MHDHRVSRSGFLMFVVLTLLANCLLKQAGKSSSVPDDVSKLEAIVSRATVQNEEIPRVHWYLYHLKSVITTALFGRDNVQSKRSRDRLVL